MADIITTLHKRNDPSVDIYPNVKDTNIPDTILRVADLGKYVNLLTSIKINGDADYVSVTADVGTFATADITTLNVSGISQFEGKSTFGSDVEVDGGLTLNSPSSLHFKTGDTDYTDFNTFLSAYYATAYQFKLAGAVLGEYEELADSFNFVSFPDISKATSLLGIFSNALISIGSIVFPAFESTVDLVTIAESASADVDFTITFNGGTLHATNTFYNTEESFRHHFKKCLTEGSVATKIQNQPYNMFFGCTGLEEVGAFDMSAVTATENIFYACTSLKSIHCKHWVGSFDISVSTQFEQSDLVEIIGNLDTVTTAQTLTMGATNLAKLTSDQILVATGKGWTLA